MNRRDFFAALGAAGIVVMLPEETKAAMIAESVVPPLAYIDPPIIPARVPDLVQLQVVIDQLRVDSAMRSIETLFLRGIVLPSSIPDIMKGERARRTIVEFEVPGTDTAMELWARYHRRETFELEYCRHWTKSPTLQGIEVQSINVDYEHDVIDTTLFDRDDQRRYRGGL